ncbi:hypothetical protein UA08_03245 [Talaromyces atroroseus]|uniref:Uncharacterized protein n=1 Tax=Talaromyces atroroseus TaxID=1441469 RepID=A0A225B114_TALAT|nr:hypothetical protein UA08_03245 [Talaromyces atroroseus]OKL60946.1 hypothetical protein UA08_03245 [Talaromyces atroroseus]
MEVFFMDDSSCNPFQEKARSFLAKKAMRKRLAEQKRARDRTITASKRAITPEKQTIETTRHERVTHKPVMELALRLQQELTPLERPIQLPSKRSVKSKCQWGVSYASCPNPSQAGRSAFRTSNIVSLISPVIALASKVHLSKWQNQDEQRKMQILALTYRGEAMKMARKQLCVATNTAEDNSSLVQHHRDLAVESQYIIILQLVLMDYFCFPTQAQAHFAASRKLVRSFTGDSMASFDHCDNMPSFIRNRQLHHIMTAFEGTHHGPDSLFWDRGDLVYLRENLYRFVCRVSDANTISAASASRGMKYMCRPRVHPQSLVWQCLIKVPEHNAGDSFSECHGQLAVLMSLCSIFMDYEPSTVVPNQCVSELENGLLTLGVEEALRNALNLAWMVAGSLGFPIESARQRLWSILGMLYVFRQQCHKDIHCGYREELSEGRVKSVCLEFLAGNTVSWVTSDNLHSV